MGGISSIREDAARSAHRPYGKDAYRVERLLGTRLVGHCCVRWPQEVRSLALRRGMRGMHSSGEATGRRHEGLRTCGVRLPQGPLTIPLRPLAEIAARPSRAISGHILIEGARTR